MPYAHIPLRKRLELTSDKPQNGDVTASRDLWEGLSLGARVCPGLSFFSYMYTTQGARKHKKMGLKLLCRKRV